MGLEDSKRKSFRALVKSFYDLQKMRIETGNRLTTNFRVKLGQAPGEKTETMPEEQLETLKSVVDEFTRLADTVSSLTMRKRIAAIKVNDGIITDELEYALVEGYVRLLEREKAYEKTISRALSEFPIYTNFMQDVNGCGTLMSAVLISEVDITKAEYASSVWAFAGLDVVPVSSDDGGIHGEGRSKRSHHLIDREYTTKDGKQATRKSITYNPFLKTKLMGVLAPSFLKCSSPYRKHYDNYRLRVENRPDTAEYTKLHKHMMAMRYMVKMFLADLWRGWRTLEGLPVPPPYHEEKLGIYHGTGNNTPKKVTA